MDAYQQAVEWLTDHPKKICGAWHPSRQEPGYCLFGFATKTRLAEESCGCLTMIRYSEEYGTPIPGLAEVIRGDERLPADSGEITVDSLPVFAQWQRYLDKVLEREPPAMDDRIPLPTQQIEFTDDPSEVETPLEFTK